MSFSRKKKHSEAPSTLAPASGLTSSQVPSNLQSQSQSQSYLKSPQKKQQPEPVCPWSAHALPFGQSPSPYLRNAHSLSTSATTVSELFLFGGYIHSSKSPNNDLYAISTRDFSTTLLQTSGEVPSPRFGHCAVLTGTFLLIWGGNTNSGNQNAQNQSYDGFFYLLNLVSREWTRIVVQGPGPGGRCYHTMNLIGSKLFVFGGCSATRDYNDIWALDLNCLTSNPFWESYEPAPGNKKPLPRASHVSVTTGDRIIIFGGYAREHVFNDTWSFNISTREWTELQCTGSIPSPLEFHTAVLIDDVMYVYGGRTVGGTILGDLTALNMSTQRWTSFQDIGPSPTARVGHAMACDGARVFVLGGWLSPGAQVDDAKPIHVLDTKLLIYPKLESNTVKHSEEAIQLAQKLSAGQPQQPIFPSSDSDVHEKHSTSPFQRATPGELDHPASLRITRDRTPDPNDLPSLLPGINDKPRRVLGENNDSEGSTEHHAKFVTPDASEKEAARSEHERIADLEWQLSETLAERAQLTDQLAEKSALLEQAEANAAQAKKRAGLEQRDLQAKLDELLLSRDLAEANAAEVKKLAELEQRDLQAKLDELLLSRDQAEANAAEVKIRAGLEQHELQAKLDELMLSRDQAEANVEEVERRARLEQRNLQAKLDDLLLSRDLAEANAAEVEKRAGFEQRELQAKLDDLLLSRDQAEANAAEIEKRAGLEQRELQARLDDLLLSRDHWQALEQAQRASQKATFSAAEANERSQQELAGVHAKLEASESELAAVRLRLTDAEVGCAKSKAEADTLRAGTQAAAMAGLINMDVDLVMRRLMERIRSVEAEMASLRGNEKSIEEMECRNEG